MLWVLSLDNGERKQASVQKNTTREGFLCPQMLSQDMAGMVEMEVLGLCIPPQVC